MTYVIALLAKAGHGKTTIAKHLEKTYGTRTMSLAGPLKRVAQTVMNFSDAQIYGTQAEKEAIDPRYGFSARTFLQRLGTDGLRREFGSDVHVNALLRDIARISNRRDPNVPDTTPTAFVVDDARFTNEVEAIVAPRDPRGKVIGACIKIVCTDAPAPAGDMATHPSEMGIDHVPSELISATLVSSRALGVDHLVGEFEKALNTNLYLGLLAKRLRGGARKDEGVEASVWED